MSEEKRTLSVFDALDFMSSGDIVTDGKYYYAAGVTRRRDGIAIKVVHTYKTLNTTDDPIAIDLPVQWIKEMGTRNVYNVYLSAGEAAELMKEGNQVMDSNGVVHFMHSVVNPENNKSYDYSFFIDDDNIPRIDCLLEQFSIEFKDDDAFIVCTVTEEQ